jgi:plastocyanin
MRFHLKSILPFISLLILAACGGGGGGGGGGGVEVTSAGGGYGTTSPNTAPVILGGYIHTQKVCCYFNDDNDFFSPEGVIAVFKVSASDAEGDSIAFSVSGNDASKISISENDGSDEAIVSFISTPDFEAPVDANSDNIYSFNVSVSDGTLSSTQAFTITVTKDASADNADAWNGVLVKDDRYTPYNKYGSSYNLIIGALSDVTDRFITNVLNIANKMLAENDATNSVNRNLLLNNFNQYKAFQRVGSTNMSSYDPALNNDNYAGWDNINDNYAVVDFIWETTSNSPTDKQTKASQINEIVEHLLHTITLIFDKSFTSWGYEDASSDLVLAMNEAIAGGYYDPTGNDGVRAQEFAYWMILTGWDLKSLYAPDAAPEWTILTAAEMETKLPLAHKLFTDTVNGVLVNPTQAYLDSLTFSSLPTASPTPAAPATPTSTAVTIEVSVAANNSGSGNVYVIDGEQKKSLTLEVGKTYTFIHPSGHPLRFSKTSDGTHSTSSGYPSQELREYTNGVTTSTAGSTVIEVTSLTLSNGATLYYYCSLHSGMGGTITISG